MAISIYQNTKADGSISSYSCNLEKQDGILTIQDGKYDPATGVLFLDVAQGPEGQVEVVRFDRPKGGKATRVDTLPFQWPLRITVETDISDKGRIWSRALNILFKEHESDLATGFAGDLAISDSPLAKDIVEGKLKPYTVAAFKGDLVPHTSQLGEVPKPKDPSKYGSGFGGAKAQTAKEKAEERLVIIKAHLDPESQATKDFQAYSAVEPKISLSEYLGLVLGLW